MKQFFYRTVCGFFLGLSIFAPGFSGSLVAIAMGIYHDIVRIISNPFKKFKQNLWFCLAIGTGVIISAVLFVIVFKQLFDHYEKATYLLFIGLIMGSIPIVLKEAKKSGFRPYYLIGAVIAFALAVAIGMISAESGLMSGNTASMSDWQGLALGGFAAGVTALIPGMSLSTVLVVLGVYSPLIYDAESLLRREMSYLLPIGIFFLCTILGLLSTAKIIKYIFEKYAGFANITVLGFIFGSLFSIGYQSHFIEDTNFTWLLGGIMLAIGFVIAISFLVLGKLMNKDETDEESSITNSPEAQ